jgi:alpha-galactosidase
MSLWAILSAPLLAGNDLSKMDETTKSILINKEVIAVDQEQVGNSGEPPMAATNLDEAVKRRRQSCSPLQLHIDDEAEPLTLKFKDVGFSGPVHARDLWAHKDLGVLHDSYTVTVPQGGVVIAPDLEINTAT